MFESTLHKGALERVPTPAHLGTVLMCNEGYLFASVPEEFQNEDERVPIYNIEQLVGHITYERDGDTVKVTIEDVENNQGDILTRAAHKAMQ